MAFSVWELILAEGLGTSHRDLHSQIQTEIGDAIVSEIPTSVLLSGILTDFLGPAQALLKTSYSKEGRC